MANAVLLRKLLLAVLLMFGFAWLLVPLYRVLCEVSGLNRVVQADTLPDAGANLPGTSGGIAAGCHGAARPALAGAAFAIPAAGKNRPVRPVAVRNAQ
jgi:hypothetical protein